MEKGIKIMLKGIPNIIPPELLKILMEMGHGDEIVIADGNFPGASHAQHLVRCDGHGVPEILRAILTLMPLDPYVDAPCKLMGVVNNDPIPEIWDTYHQIVDAFEPKNNQFQTIERNAFYEQAKKAYCIMKS